MYSFIWNFIYFFYTDQIEGCLGPLTVVLDHSSGFEGLLFVDDDLLGVRELPYIHLFYLKQNINKNI